MNSTAKIEPTTPAAMMSARHCPRLPHSSWKPLSNRRNHLGKASPESSWLSASAPHNA